MPVESSSTLSSFKHCSNTFRFVFCLLRGICNWEASSFEEAGKTCVNSSSASRQDVTKMSGLSGVGKNNHEKVWDIWGVQEGIPLKAGGLVGAMWLWSKVQVQGTHMWLLLMESNHTHKRNPFYSDQKLWHSYKHRVPAEHDLLISLIWPWHGLPEYTLSAGFLLCAAPQFAQKIVSQGREPHGEWSLRIECAIYIDLIPFILLSDASKCNEFVRQCKGSNCHRIEQAYS